MNEGMALVQGQVPSLQERWHCWTMARLETMTLEKGKEPQQAIKLSVIALQWRWLPLSIPGDTGYETPWWMKEGLIVQQNILG